MILPFLVFPGQYWEYSLVCIIKLFTVVRNSVMQQARVFVTVSHFQPGLAFVHMAGAHLRVESHKDSTWVGSSLARKY